jgi:predicted LPLAT superfamily acyltransferase/glycosyltransferase involved in cell wall biosynthesis
MILRVGIAIPTYNNPLTIAQVVADCLEHTEFPILVVDDGSTDPVEKLIARSLQSGRVQVVRHETNQGKGVALQTAFKKAIEMDCTHLVSIDGDGQHFATDIPAMVQAALESPWDLIVGHRRMISETVPKISKFGRSFSNFWVRFQTDTKVADSQSGFRCYPLFFVQNLHFVSKRFDFEIEVLIRLIWKGVGVREVEIAVHYPKAGERVSHFNKLWDNVRISSLNAVLVTLSLLRVPQSAMRMAAAIGLGVFIGTLPLIGFHSLIAAGASVLFRLNFIGLIIGTQISIPPMMPLLVIAAVHLSKTLGISWWAGFLVLGAGLGTAAFFLSWLLLGIAKRKQVRRASWTGKMRGGVFGNWLMKMIGKFGGLRAAYFCLYFIVPYFYLFAPKARRSMNEYYGILRPEVGYWRRQWLVMNHLHRFARVLVDRVCQQFHETPMFRIREEGLRNITDSVQAKTGLLMVTAHVGGWDLAATALKQKGHSDEFKVVKYAAPGLNFDRVAGMDRTAQRDQVLLGERTGGAQAVFQIRELLLRGHPVGLMADRPVSQYYELVKFCGKLAPMDTTPFRVGALCSTPVLFTFGFKSPVSAGEYDFYATPVRHYPARGVNRELQAFEGLQDFCRTLESFVRMYPDQWFNFYPFWSTPPNPPEDVAATADQKAKLPGRNSLLQAHRKSPTH